MVKSVFLLPLLLGGICLQVESANILFFIGFGGPSHRIAVEPLANALFDKGHNVTFLAQMPPKEKSSKFDVYVPKVMAAHFLESRKDIDYYNLRATGRIVFMPLIIHKFGLEVCENLYKDPEFMNWVNVKHFDLVIIDSLFNECAYGIAHKHKAKTILFSISTVLPWIIDGVGLPDETSSIPDPMLPFPQDKSFAQRVISTLYPVFFKLLRQFYYLPALTKITAEGFNDQHFPSFKELEKNTSLVLLNTHVSQEYPRALPPGAVPVGGISWIHKRKPIPKHIEDFINQGKEGFVYVSFGSFMDFLTFPQDVQQRFVDALKRFPNIQFIWKLNKTPENLPKHILVEKWLPQQDLLLHPNIRAFITHSGIGGVNEAIYSSVPLICFPLFTEQDYNANIVDKKGFGIKMEITALTTEGLENAIREILTNKSYSETMKKITTQFLDRPMSPLDTALWWTEYVLRQDSLDFLRPLNVDLSWWSKRNLDVWFFLAALLISTNLLGIYVTIKLLKRCFGKRKSKAKRD